MSGFDSRSRSGSRRGLSLIELLVVIGIVGALAALSLPAVQAARERARAAACQSNLRRLALGLLRYEGTRGTFPMGSPYMK